MNLAFNPNGLVISLLIKKRWHLAFVKIYCSRAFLSLFSEVLAKRNKISILTSSATFINIDQPFKDAGLFSEIEVVRNGRRQQILIFDIIVGDIVCLKIGDQVPADGLFLDGHPLQVDESSVTGESDHVEINQYRNPFSFCSTKVTDGYARMLITSVGMNTIWGEMMSSISQEANEQTPLQAQLNKLTSSTGRVGLVVAFLVLVMLLVRFFIGNTTDGNGDKEFSGFGKTKVDEVINGGLGIIAVAVTIVVVAIPEGLPLAVTLTLAYSMIRMMANQAMVRRLSAYEIMKSATTIYTEKT
ncbi:calcium-transporting ATPase 13, plasma membrane-type [Olea europaea subsp. europaea]|uniref:Calcium-transporting ATPase 13, plasma membrane-type n=1 Tax=Olea europaea subsp. europaea TaxID=158383 RepID=A0A8S0S481_OLEEU|nr:calcium-transporting ATPase 13, plasma membrane-type [Olea europaea subsp. europaea]